MQSRVTEIAPETYRASTFHSQYGIQFNQFLIKDDEPVLIHTGLKSMFAPTLEAIGSIVDPSTIRWIGFSHFESDECGALNQWLKVAPGATPVCGLVSATVSVDDFAERTARPLADGDILRTGRHNLRFLSTPHVPHGWDAGLFFDEAEGTLLCSDLFFQPGDPEAVTSSDIVGRARAAMLDGAAGPLAHSMPYTPYTGSTLKRLAALQPRTLAVMHGSSFQGDGKTALLDLSAVAKELLSGSDAC